MHRSGFSVALLAPVALALLDPCPGPARGQPPSPDALAARAFAVLEKNCSQCHGVTKAGGSLDVRNHATLVRPGKRRTYVVSRDLAKSYLWQRVADGDMPPTASCPRPTRTCSRRGSRPGLPRRR